MEFNIPELHEKSTVKLQHNAGVLKEGCEHRVVTDEAALRSAESQHVCVFGRKKQAHCDGNVT